MHSTSSTSDSNAAPRAPGPGPGPGLGPGPGQGYALLLRPVASATHCYCHLCARSGPSPVAVAPVPEFNYGLHPCPPQEEQEGVVTPEGPRARRPFPPQRRRRASKEEGPERNGVDGGHVPPRNPARRVDFYLGPNHCAMLGDYTPGFPREWDPCYSPPPRWNWPVVEPCQEHCACARDVRPEWERPPPPLALSPAPPCYYPPERRPLSASRAPHSPAPEFRGHPRHGEVVRSGLEEPCWECVRERYWRDQRRPDLVAVDSVCGYNGQCQQQPALSPVLPYGHEPAYEHQRLSRHASPEHGTCNGPTLGQRTFFPTEVPPAKLRGPEESGSCLPKSVNGPQRREPKSDGRKQKESTSGPVNEQQSQGTVREQIRRVVGDLEEVLGGLKQVHLEMKEVVQQIDVLTSNIDLDEDELSRQTSHEPLLQQQAICHEVKALVHRPADAPTPQAQQQPQQLQDVNGHHATTPTPKPSTCHPSVTRRGHSATTGNMHRVTALKSGHETAKDRSKPNGNCVAHRPVRDRVKDAQRRRIELACPPSSVLANGGTTSVKNHKPPPYPNHNGRVETLLKDSDMSVGALRTGAQQGKGRQLSTAV